MDDFERWRQEFPVLTTSTYLISNSLGAMPRQVHTRLEEYAESWASRGVRAWEESWWELGFKIGERLGLLLGAAPADLSFHQNVTLTQAVIASCFEYRAPRNKVVMVDMEFPSI